MASYVAGELIPWAFVWLSIPELPHVAKLRDGGTRRRPLIRACL